MRVKLAVVDDAEAILELQKLCYQSESTLIADSELPPVTQTLESMRGEFDSKVVLKAVEKGRIIGSVRARVEDDTCLVAGLMVHPDFRGKGFGKKLIHSVEAIFVSARRFELFAGDKSLSAVSLFESIGYHELRRETVSPRLTLIYMEKIAY